MHCFPNCLSNGCKLTSACPCHGKLSFPPLFHITIDWECIVRSIHCRHVNCYSGHMKEGLLKPSCFRAKRGWGICMRNAWFLVTWEAASKVLDRMCIPIQVICHILLSQGSRSLKQACISTSWGSWWESIHPQSQGRRCRNLYLHRHQCSGLHQQRDASEC